MAIWVQMSLNIEWGTTTPSSGFVLKAYLPGTTTSTSIAITNTGGSPQASLTTNAAGLFEVTGNAVLPFIDRKHKWALFANAVDAAANSNPFAGFYDNVEIEVTVQEFATVAAMVADTTLEVGQFVKTQGYLAAGDAGDMQYEVVAAATGTDDNGSFIDLDTHQAKALFPQGLISTRQFGASPTTSAPNNKTFINSADAYAASVNKPLYHSAGTYPVTLGLVALTMTTSWYGDGPDKSIIQRFDFGVARDDGSNITKAVTVDNIFLRDMGFDGQVTTVAASGTPNQDLGATGSYNDDTTEQLWTGSFGCDFTDCNNLRIHNCKFTNFLRAGIKVEAAGVVASNRTSINVIITDNEFIRNRGIFGDSIFLENIEAGAVSGNRIFDFQRIGITLEQKTVIVSNSRDSRDFTIIGNLVEFGHDAVTTGGGVENNACFWIESGDNVHIGGGNVAKDCAIGFVLSENDKDDTGTLRPYGVLMTITDCSSILTRIGAYLVHNRRGGKISVSNCFFQSDSTAAPNSFMTITDSSDGQQAGIKIFSRQDLANVKSSIDISSTHIECKERGSGAINDVFGAILISNASSAASIDTEISLRDISTTWVDSAGATDTLVEAFYQAGGDAGLANFFGAYGDVVLGGGDESPTNDRLDGSLTVDNFTNQSIGYCMFAASVDNSGVEIKIENTRVSIRTADVNNGRYFISGCALVDWRRNWNADYISISNSRIEDADTTAVDRTPLTVTYMKITGCDIRRQLFINNNGNLTSTIKPVRLDIVGNHFFIDATNESMVKINSANVTFSRLYLSANQFQHIPRS